MNPQIAAALEPPDRPSTPRDAKFGTGHVEASTHGSNVDRTVTFERAHDLNGAFLADGMRFRDAHGRTLLVRGVNVSGNSKLPTSPPGSTHLGEGFYDHRNVSFIGRPFPLADVDENFARLRAWGLTFIRLLVTWEALEHKGPGIYDEEYIDYLIKVLKKAPEYGIKCFIDPHQDTWSRFSGGSGAPGWTFEVAGMDLTKFMETGAAYVHQKALPQDSGHCAWPTNYQKLASATMFTLFFGGDIFAPKAMYQGEPVQQFLQRHFCAAFQHLATRLKDTEAVVGFELLNEPHMGYIGLRSVHHFDPLKDLHYGDYPSALQSMALGSAIPQEVDVWTKSWPWPTRRSGRRVINANKASAWLPGRECVWKQHGVWNLDTYGNPQALIPDYFSKKPDGTAVNFYSDCYVPLLKRYKEAINSANPKLLVFFEPIPNEDPPVLSEGERDRNYVYAPHWYDLQALFTKSFGFVTHDVQALSRGTKNVLAATYFGITGANKNYKGQLRNIVQAGVTKVGKMPCLIGECGIPMDLNEKRAFETGNYEDHTNFLDAVINAMEASLVNFTLWNYNPHNDNEWGDHWNGEDFSIYSPTVSRTGSPAPSRPASRTSRTSRTSRSRSSSTSSNRSRSTSPISPKAPASPLRLQVSQPKQLRRPSATGPITPFDITDVAIEDAEGDAGSSEHLGGRALDAVIRPYAAKIAGEPTLMKFDLGKLEFNLEFERAASEIVEKTVDSSASTLLPTRAAPEHITEIFVPNFHYGGLEKLEVTVSDGEWKYNRTRQTLYWRIKPSFGGGKGGTGMVKHWIRIRPPGGGEGGDAVVATYNPLKWLGDGVRAVGGWCGIL
ncbi:hypothetical protein HK097_010362 [Rhizophlyctis rosea]|uniref:Glycoside hydrolase family 5 n=1 Tax=Rhizophlyctis rosea TaxID=64517 RepID=A0AAD5SA05_9FUNG|nr:hypothetical protein HK097_010362 [Rhizophlyctis rosea]